MATSLVEAAKAWEQDKTFMKEVLMPSFIILGNADALKKETYHSFPTTSQPKLEGVKFIKPIFEYNYLEDIHVGNKLSEKYDEFGYVTFLCNEDYNPQHRPVKLIGPVAPPEKFKKVMRRVGSTLIPINEGCNHVCWQKSDNINIYPKETYQREADRHGVEDQQYEYVLAHELIHLTGTPGRLRRRTLKNYQGISKEKEECVAIIGSRMLLENLGYILSSETLERHERLLASWEGSLLYFSRIRARKKAEEAVNYLLTGEIKWYKRVLNKLMKT